jgi:hypothetical protein
MRPVAQRRPAMVSATSATTATTAQAMMMASSTSMRTPVPARAPGATETGRQADGPP